MWVPSNRNYIPKQHKTIGTHMTEQLSFSVVCLFFLIYFSLLPII